MTLNTGVRRTAIESCVLLSGFVQRRAASAFQAMSESTENVSHLGPARRSVLRIRPGSWAAAALSSITTTVVSATKALSDSRANV